MHQELVPVEKMLDGEVAVRCAHGDTMKYQIAQVCMYVQVAVGETGVLDTLGTKQT